MHCMYFHRRALSGSVSGVCGVFDVCANPLYLRLLLGCEFVQQSEAGGVRCLLRKSLRCNNGRGYTLTLSTLIWFPVTSLGTGPLPFLFLYFSCWELLGRQEQLCLLWGVCSACFTLAARRSNCSWLHLGVETNPWETVSVCVCVCPRVCVCIKQPVPMVIAFPKWAKSGG